MTKLLVSVRDASEACAAIAAGVDLIDVKEPTRGSLGAASGEVVAEVSAVLAGRVPLSVACGELLDDSQQAGRWSGDYQGRINFAKVGLAGCAAVANWSERWRRAMADWPASVSPVAVVYADWQMCGGPAPENVLHYAGKLRCRALLVDTFDKSAGNLLSHLSIDELEALGVQVREQGLMYVLAGSLDVASIKAVASLEPDYVAVRGAVCSGSREGTISEEKVREIKSVLETARAKRFSA